MADIKDITQIVEGRLQGMYSNADMEYVSVRLEVPVNTAIKMYLLQGGWHPDFDVGTPRDGRRSLNAIYRAAIYNFLWEHMEEFDPEGAKILKEFHAEG